MAHALPLFPLGTVLLPGLVLPLHVFEPRYRALVRDLLDLPADAPRRFGVVAVRSGSEVGAAAARELYGVGCTAEVRHVEELDDGRFALVTVGTERFALVGVDAASRPYLVGAVEPLGEEVGDPGALDPLVREVQRAFVDYQRALAAARGEPPPAAVALPDDPLPLSWLVAAGLVTDLDDVQGLLAAPAAVERLRTGLRLLARETRLLRRVPALPTSGLVRAPQSLN